MNLNFSDANDIIESPFFKEFTNKFSKEQLLQRYPNFFDNGGMNPLEKKLLTEKFYMSERDLISSKLFDCFMSMCRDPEEASAKGLPWQVTGKLVIEGIGLLEFDVQQHETFANILQYIIVLLFEIKTDRGNFIHEQLHQEESS